MSVNKPTIVFLSTYPPRECGIATFTHDLVSYSKKILGSDILCKVAAFNLSPLDTYKYPSEVAWEIDQNNDKEYIKLANIVNNDPNILGIILQHEYGIFGGIDGEKILLFMKKCKKPILVTLHTALPAPSSKMKEVTTKIIDLASSVVVLTKNSKEIIEKVYPECTGKIFIIPHGIHPVTFSFQKKYKTKLELNKHIVVSTFGLLSRGKGIEYAIKALPAVIKKYPSLIYLILGETHPVIRRNEGEEYRLELAQLITTLGLEKHVKFYDQYLSLPDLLEFLQATDIYISTSINPDQAVSGTLSYALGTGRAVISTNFAQAREFITPDIGRLVAIKDSQAFSVALLDLLSDEKKLQQIDHNAYDKTRSMVWGNVAKRYFSLLTQMIIPPVNMQHLYDMTDSTGLFQFSILERPDKNSGYTLDDNARALIACCWLRDVNNSKKIDALIDIYLAFIQKCQGLDGKFINYISFTKTLPTEQNYKEDLDDTQGRAMWALSEVIHTKTLSNSVRDSAKKMFVSSLDITATLHHLRAKAFMIKAYGLVLQALPEHKEKIVEYMKVYANDLVVELKKNSLKSWFWFEKDLSYNNALLSESLLIAGDILKKPEYSNKGIQSLQFLISKTFSPDMYMPIGHAGWYTNKEKRSQYDQQPEDPAAMVLALSAAYHATHNQEYKNLVKKCFSWFLGNNSLNKSLYDEKTGGCFDGLHPDRVNLNQGAESLVSYLMANSTTAKID